MFCKGTNIERCDPFLMLRVFFCKVLADAGRDSAEASIMAEGASAWASTVAELVDGEALAAKGQALRARLEELNNR